MSKQSNVINIYPIILLSLFALIGCDKDKVAGDNQFENTIDFENLQEGQKTYYIKYRANSYTYLDGFKLTRRYSEVRGEKIRNSFGIITA